LVLPLSGHDFRIGTRDLDTGIQASLVVSLYDITAHDLAGTDSAVVWSLGSGETRLGPAVWPSVHAKEGVLLLETEPVFLGLVGVHEDFGGVTEIVAVWFSIGHPGFADDQDVVTKTDRIGEVGFWAKVDIGVVTRGLASGGTVKVPFWKICDLFDSLGEGLRIWNEYVSNCETN
jgi:hypothetical protein